MFRHTLEYCTMIFNKPKGWSNYARNNNKVKIKEMRMFVKDRQCQDFSRNLNVR